MNEVLMDEPVLPQPTDRFLSFTNTGLNNYFSLPNGTLKEIWKKKCPLVEFIRNLRKSKVSKIFVLVRSAIEILLHKFSLIYVFARYSKTKCYNSFNTKSSWMKHIAYIQWPLVIVIFSRRRRRKIL